MKTKKDYSMYAKAWITFICLVFLVMSIVGLMTVPSVNWIVRILKLSDSWAEGISVWILMIIRLVVSFFAFTLAVDVFIVSRLRRMQEGIK